MGNWGPGNFDNDAARDYLFDLTRALADDVDRAFDAATAFKLSGPASGVNNAQLAEQLEIVLPSIEIMCVLHETLEGGFLPEPSLVEEWQARFEQLRPECSSPSTDVLAKRRAVIEATFARFLQLARQCWDE